MQGNIGQSGRKLITRYKEHQRQPFNNTNYSDIAAYSIEYNHFILKQIVYNHYTAMIICIGTFKDADIKKKNFLTVMNLFKIKIYAYNLKMPYPTKYLKSFFQFFYLKSFKNTIKNI